MKKIIITVIITLVTQVACTATEKDCNKRDGDGDGIICEGEPNEQHG